MTRKSKKLKYYSDEELYEGENDEETVYIPYNNHFDEIYDLYLELREYCDDFILPLLDRSTGADFYQFIMDYSLEKKGNKEIL